MYQNTTNKGFAQIPIILGLLLMAVAIPVATNLVKQNQDTRNYAAGDCCGSGYTCSGYCSNATYSGCLGTCVKDSPTNTPKPCTSTCPSTSEYCSGVAIYNGCGTICAYGTKNCSVSPTGCVQSDACAANCYKPNTCTDSCGATHACSKTAAATAVPPTQVPYSCSTTTYTKGGNSTGCCSGYTESCSGNTCTCTAAGKSCSNGATHGQTICTNGILATCNNGTLIDIVSCGSYGCNSTANGCLAATSTPTKIPSTTPTSSTGSCSGGCVSYGSSLGCAYNQDHDSSGDAACKAKFSVSDSWCCVPKSTSTPTPTVTPMLAVSVDSCKKSCAADFSDSDCQAMCTWGWSVGVCESACIQVAYNRGKLSSAKCSTYCSAGAAYVTPTPTTALVNTASCTSVCKTYQNLSVDVCNIMCSSQRTPGSCVDICKIYATNNACQTICSSGLSSTSGTPTLTPSPTPTINQTCVASKCSNYVAGSADWIKCVNNNCSGPTSTPTPTGIKGTATPTSIKTSGSCDVECRAKGYTGTVYDQCMSQCIPTPTPKSPGSCDVECRSRGLIGSVYDQCMLQCIPTPTNAQRSTCLNTCDTNHTTGQAYYACIANCAATPIPTQSSDACYAKCDSNGSAGQAYYSCLQNCIQATPTSIKSVPTTVAVVPTSKPAPTSAPPAAPTSSNTNPSTGSCSYVSLQARVQIDVAHAWVDQLTISGGSSVDLLCAYNGVGLAASNVQIVAAYSTGAVTTFNGGTATAWKPSNTGNYTIYCKSTDSKCSGLTSDAAVLKVGGGVCKQCPNDFSCYGNSTGYKWFASGYVADGYTEVPESYCTSTGLTKPTWKGKEKGDANCDGSITVADYSIWQSEYASIGGYSVNSTDWEADFTGSPGVCDGVVNGADFSLWRRSFIDLGGN